jgi:transcriptional regulator NrdR family protein
MSSSPPNAPPMNRPRARRPVRFASLACPICGRRSLVDVVEDCELSGGRLLRRLRHTRCTSCGERFFDVAAMAAIEATSKPTSRRRSA